MRSRAWCFTLNNYTDLELAAFLGTTCRYIIVGFEIAPDTSTPHLQGYIYFKNAKSLTSLKNICSRSHWESAHGTPQENRTYCSKSGNFKEVGELPKKGARTDLVSAAQDMSAGISTSSLISTYGDIFLNSYKKVQHISKILTHEKNTKSLRIQFPADSLRSWQQRALKKLLKQNDRRVLWIHDNGNTGKTYLAKVLVLHHNAIYFNNSKSSDISFAYDNQPIVIFDFARCTEEYINYGTIETLKNGILFSSKYESSQKLFHSPKIIIFSNFVPDKAKLSADRWNCYTIDNEMKLIKQN